MFQTPYRVKTGVVLTILFAVGVSIVMAVVPIWQPSHQLALRWEAELDILNDLEVQNAATKIQATFRRMKLRAVRVPTQMTSAGPTASSLNVNGMHRGRPRRPHEGTYCRPIRTHQK